METDKNRQVSKITKEYLGNRYSKSTEEKLQRWLIEENDSEEKEQASLEYWNTLEIQPGALIHVKLKQVRLKLGIQATVPLHRKLMRIAAILIPALLIFGGAYCFLQKEDTIQVVAKNGETKHVILLDNSEVWLNAGSIMQYPEKISKDNRSVTLDGEAYFSIQKDESKPFVVSTDKLSVKVLGTEFNVKAYESDNRTIITLSSGKVEVQTHTHQTKILEPNEQLVYDHETADIHILNISADEISSWKSGDLIFADATTDEIWKTLERRFDLSIDADKSVGQTGGNYTVKFIRNDSIEHILNVLKDIIGDFSYQKQGNKIEIKTKK